MVINISTNKEKVYKQYLSILNPVLTNRKLTTIEIEVLAKLLYINDLYSKYTKAERDKILFHRDTKEKIRLSIDNLSKFSYNNVLTSLRKKQLINKKELMINIPIKDDKIEVHYNLIIK